MRKVIIGGRLQRCPEVSIDRRIEVAVHRAMLSLQLTAAPAIADQRQ